MTDAGPHAINHPKGNCLHRVSSNVALALSLVVMLSGSGCKRPPAAKPVIKLECRFEKGGDSLLIFLLDPAKKLATVANIDGAPKGSLGVSDYEYTMDFPAQAPTAASRVVVNRYDGVMTREFGSPPFSKDGTAVKSGNVLQPWRCARAAAGPRF